MKYINQKTASLLNPTMKVIGNEYDSTSEQIVVIAEITNYNATTYLTNNLLYIFNINASDGSLNWESQLQDYAGDKITNFKFAIHPDFQLLMLMFSNNEFDYYHSQSIRMADGSHGPNTQFEVTFHFKLSGLEIFPSGGSVFETDDIVFTGEGGYVMKINPRKSNLAVIDNTTLLTPMTGIHYDNFSLPETTPTDFELGSYSPAADFLADETGYEINSLGYTYQIMTPPQLDILTEMAIGFNKTQDCSSGSSSNL